MTCREIRAFLSYSGRHYRPCYWRSYDNAEVDVLCETAAGFAAIEIKAARRWDRRFNRGFRRVREHLGERATTCYGVHLGPRPARWDDVQVLPVLDFLERLWNGEVLR